MNRSSLWLCVPVMIFAISSPARGQQMIIESLDGPVTQNEIDSYKAFMQRQTPIPDNFGNRLAYHTGAQALDSLGRRRSTRAKRSGHRPDRLDREPGALLADRGESRRNGRSVDRRGAGLRPNHSIEDAGHAAFDMWGLWLAYNSGRYAISDDSMTAFANTVMYRMNLGNGTFAQRTDGGGATQNNLQPPFLNLAKFVTDLYGVIATADLRNARSTAIYEAGILWVKNARFTGVFPQ